MIQVTHLVPSLFITRPDRMVTLSSHSFTRVLSETLARNNLPLRRLINTFLTMLIIFLAPEPVLRRLTNASNLPYEVLPSTQSAVAPAPGAEFRMPPSADSSPHICSMPFLWCRTRSSRPPGRPRVLPITPSGVLANPRPARIRRASGSRPTFQSDWESTDSRLMCPTVLLALR